MSAGVYMDFRTLQFSTLCIPCEMALKKWKSLILSEAHLMKH